MPSRLSAVFACILVLAALSPDPARAGGISTRQLLAAMGQPNELGRYGYLLQAMPQLDPTDKNLAQQYFAFSENELGLYGEAVRDFPLKSRLPAGIVLPAPPDWQVADALDTIVDLAAHRRVVMINEAHHDAHTRLLTLELLPRLRALGYTHLAIEALVEGDAALRRRGYPSGDSGSEYLREPVYGEIVREALRLGYVLVPYDPAGRDPDDRESQQARTLYDKVLAGNTNAKLLVHAGYAHIDKAPGRLIRLQPMAARLQELSGLEPLSIDQTEIMETGWNTTDLYHRLVARFPSKEPEILVDRDGKPWSARPTLYDANVILPPSLSMAAFGNQQKFGSALDAGTNMVSDTSRFSLLRQSLLHMQRPDWLRLGGQRRPYDIDTTLCRSTTPCLVEAHYAGEPDDATAADRYAFMKPAQATRLFLRPGHYRLRAWDLDGRTLSEREIDISQP